MPINAGKMEVLRDFWNTEHHRITKIQQVRQITPIPIHLEAEIQLHYRIEKILLEYENDDDDDGRNSLFPKKNIVNADFSKYYSDDDDNEVN